MVLNAESSVATRAGLPARQAWLVAGLSIAVVAVALCLLFLRETVGAYQVWLESTAYNHCFLILPVALYLAWMRRDALTRLAPQPEWRALALVVPLAFAWLAAALVSVLEAQQLIVMTMFEVIALAVLGWRAYRAMLMPFLYLYFLVPTGYFLVPWLQNVTAWFAIEGLRLVNIPVYSDGMFIEVPAGSFIIAEACAGLRFLIASIAFGVFFAAMMYRSRVRWVVFVALSVIVPIIANGIRAWGIIALAQLVGNAQAVEADHIIYGWGFFTFVMIVLIVIGMRFAEDRVPAKKGEAAKPTPATQLSESRVWSAGLAALLGVLIAATGPAYAEFRDWRGAGASLANAPAPPSTPSWTSVDAAHFAWRPAIERPDREFLDAQSDADGDTTILRYVALYNQEGFHNNLVRANNEVVDLQSWQLVSRGTAEATIGGVGVPVATTEVSNGGHKLLVWHFYVVGGKVIASPLKTKLAQLENLFLPGTGVAAYVALATEDPGGAHAARALARYAAAMTPPSTYLAGIKPAQ